ncbi:Fic family protein [Brenneria izbisi]|uniref:Fic family protein n=1 Tax=Brenneria izbisi TaxID=2939450 RepID=A0AA41XX13_9GAMM|nr:Fic family protein [Brenneria izbisi]MCV9878818.1 Fic family protein [Brenneria izbisi]MCV9881999.1 Fic family protein [Brenneria izbisi]
MRPIFGAGQPPSAYIEPSGIQDAQISHSRSPKVSGAAAPASERVSSSGLPHVEKISLKQALTKTTSLSRLEQLPLGGRFLSALSCFRPAPSLPIPPRGPAFGQFMASVDADVSMLADKTGVDKFTAAEQMRKAIETGDFGAKAKPENKIRMMLALYSIRETESARQELASVMAKHPTFSSVNIDNVWRMLIDSSAHDDGRHNGLRFENEPGYIAGMYRGLAQVLHNDLRADGDMSGNVMIKQLHDKAIDGVIDFSRLKRAVNLARTGDPAEVKALLAHVASYTSTTRPAHTPGVTDDGSENVLKFMDKGYRTESVFFSLNQGKNCSQQGFNELLDRYFSSANELPFSFWNYKENRGESMEGASYETATVGLCSRPFEEIPPSLQPAPYTKSQFNHYRQEIAAAKNDDDKLSSIARLCCNLEQAHCFTDGNARTLGFLLVNQLLLENALSPTVITDPNRFDGFSNQELVDEIKKGQRLFNQL